MDMGEHMVLEPTCVSATNLPLPPEQTAALSEYGIWSPPWADPPAASDLGRNIEVPPALEDQVLIWKNALLVREGVTGTVSVVSPPHAKLIITTEKEWSTELTADVVKRRETRTVHVRSCENAPGSYPGVIVMDSPACVVLSIKVDGHTEQRLQVPYFGAQCTEDLGRG
ncbi:hypothetical protein [Luethyella okanaganae]|uniref:Uncharacterized protein n=1 Tax=Luethyella okanaganae TaxID=69372 RepID=A0ABW1VGG0_9MICO